MTVVDESECFLCQPDSGLIVAEHRSIFSMAGLGPITSRYLLIATSVHVDSFADMYLQDQGIAKEIEALRAIHQHGTNPLLMVEHGRVPTCQNVGDERDAHCFHAHFLLFQSTRCVEEKVSSYFLGSEVFNTLSSALQYASKHENYHLLSPHSERYLVYSGALNVPRQFFRMVVALAENQSELADWRDHPNMEKAIQIARNEREALEGCNGIE